MNDREKLFFVRHQDETGHTMIEQPAIFRFSIDGVMHRFEPDFFCPDCQIFFEVSATRQAFHQDKFKLKAMKAYFSSIKLEVVTAFGNPYNMDKVGLDYENGKALPNDFTARKDFDLRMRARERLISFVGDSSERCGLIVDDTHICRNSVKNMLNKSRLPNSKTSQLINRFLDGIEQEWKTA